MITPCPECGTRYRVPPEKLGPQGARIRCQKCQHVFKVEPPEPELEPEIPAVPITAHAVVAEADADKAKAIAAYLEERGIAARVFSDGGEALLHLHRERPDLILLGGRLPGLRGPMIAEILRRNPDLQDVPLIRVSSLDEPVGVPEFDADHTLDPADLPDGLGPLLENLSLGSASPAARSAAPARPAEPAPAPRPPAAESPERPSAPAPSPVQAPAPARPEAGVQEGSLGPDALKKAERLARIVVSDIILYNEDKFAAASDRGDVARSFTNELQEARAMFNDRVPAELRADRDFLVEELERRAAKRRS